MAVIPLNEQNILERVGNEVKTENQNPDSHGGAAAVAVASRTALQTGSASVAGLITGVTVAGSAVPTVASAVYYPVSNIAGVSASTLREFKVIGTNKTVYAQATIPVGGSATTSGYVVPSNGIQVPPGETGWELITQPVGATGVIDPGGTAVVQLLKVVRQAAEVTTEPSKAWVQQGYVGTVPQGG